MASKKKLIGAGWGMPHLLSGAEKEGRRLSGDKKSYYKKIVVRAICDNPRCGHIWTVHKRAGILHCPKCRGTYVDVHRSDEGHP